MTKTLIDTNILFYAFTNQDPIKKDNAIKIIEEKTKKKELVLSIQNITELNRTCKEKTQHMTDEQIIQNAYYLTLASEIIYYQTKTTIEAVKISTQYKIHYFDSLLIATMQENQIQEIITENTKDFERIPWLKVTNPFK